MKKTLTLLLCCIMTFGASAQLYFGLNTNLSIPRQGQTLEGIGLYNFSSTFNSVTYEEVKTSFGGGAFTGATIGLHLNKKVAVELNGGYHFSNTVTSKDSYVDGAYDYTFKTRSLSLRPSVLFIISENQKQQLYTKIGAVYSMGDLDLSIEGERSSQRLEVNSTYFKASGLGIQTAIGVNWLLKNGLSLTTELTYVNLSLSPKSSELTEYRINGSSQLDTMSIAEKQIEYVPEFTLTASTPQNQPEKRLRFDIPFSGVGLNIGLRLTMNKKEE